MTQIKRVIPKDDYRLEVQINNGNSVILNFESRLHTIRFGLLADKLFFQQDTTDGDCVRWGNKIELSASEVFQLVQKEKPGGNISQRGLSVGTKNKSDTTQSETFQTSVAASVPVVGVTITAQPSDIGTLLGNDAELTVTATGSGTLTYQWYKQTVDTNINGTAIPGGIHSAYLAPTISKGTTLYYCRVTDTMGLSLNTKITDSVAVTVVEDTFTYQDRYGYDCISYYDGTNFDLKYAFQDIDGDCIRWGSKIEISSSEVFN